MLNFFLLIEKMHINASKGRFLQMMCFLKFLEIPCEYKIIKKKKASLTDTTSCEQKSNYLQDMNGERSTSCLEKYSCHVYVALSLYPSRFRKRIQVLRLSVGASVGRGLSQTSHHQLSPTTSTHPQPHIKTNINSPIPDRFTSTVSLTSSSFYMISYFNPPRRAIYYSRKYLTAWAIEISLINALTHVRGLRRMSRTSFWRTFFYVLIFLTGI